MSVLFDFYTNLVKMLSPMIKPHVHSGVWASFHPACWSAVWASTVLAPQRVPPSAPRRREWGWWYLAPENRLDTSREGALDQGNLTRRRQVGSLIIGWHNCGGPRLGKPCQNSFSLRETLGFLSLASMWVEDAHPHYWEQFTWSHLVVDLHQMDQIPS